MREQEADRERRARPRCAAALATTSTAPRPGRTRRSTRVGTPMTRSAATSRQPGGALPVDRRGQHEQRDEQAEAGHQGVDPGLRGAGLAGDLPGRPRPACAGRRRRCRPGRRARTRGCRLRARTITWAAGTVGGAPAAATRQVGEQPVALDQRQRGQPAEDVGRALVAARRVEHRLAVPGGRVGGEHRDLVGGRGRDSLERAIGGDREQAVVDGLGAAGDRRCRGSCGARSPASSRSRGRRCPRGRRAVSTHGNVVSPGERRELDVR